ncbi:ankyrin repeat-containing protein ITN1-like [Capsella rubella]|uniref:ankyrin repeat-containing protein ITN1-like n=1 Tax=Capsella rubella TaxID=81985 RepID=UPI000CD535FD|nr:ankyrin repeat-containing protein ITN1-like [Capsella rubella]
MFHEAKMKSLAHKLVEDMWNLVIKKSDREVSDLLRSPTRLLFDAASSGNVEFLVILIRSYPDLIWKVDGKNRSLFHVAALNRHESIFNIIYELGAIKDLIASYREKVTKNTLLHLVASLPSHDRLHIVSGAALQMQREILWFKAVKKIVPRSYIKSKNSEGKVAQDLFTNGHNDLRKEGEKWMKDTATSCMLVATLIATVVFAAAFTVPGGNNEEIGLPILQNRKWFNIFILSDAVALCSSSTSIVIFLSILTSRYAEDDFLVSLPSRLMLGLLSLFVSIIAMVIAFCATLFLIYDRRFAWNLALIISLASITAFSFALLHVQLWFDTLRSAYWSKFLFQHHKHRLH